MLAVAEKRLFRPNAVFIPTKDGKEGRDFDRSDCTLLMVDGEFSLWRSLHRRGLAERRRSRAISSDGAISS